MSSRTRPNPTGYIPNRRWDTELNASLDTYLDQVERGLDHSFKETPKEAFIRKIYMSAGTDAHGDFNYTDDVEATALATLFDNASINNNAYARVRTYTLASDRESFPASNTSYDAYRDGNTVLTDGPLCMFTLDSNGRHNPQAGAALWHDATSTWENGEGRIGGRWTFDGGRTALIPEPWDSVRIFSESKKSVTPGAGGIATYNMVMRTRDQRQEFNITNPGPRGASNRQPLPVELNRRAAILMKGHDSAIDKRCITNPVWVVPVSIEVQHPGSCPIPARSLKATFRFPISMKNQITEVGVRRLDCSGASIDDPIALDPAPGWEEDFSLVNGKYSATNTAPIDCPPADRDAVSHTKVKDLRSYVVYMYSPTDIHDNTLNHVARTFVITFVPPPATITPPDITPSPSVTPTVTPTPTPTAVITPGTTPARTPTPVTTPGAVTTATPTPVPSPEPSTQPMSAQEASDRIAGYTSERDTFPNKPLSEL